MDHLLSKEERLEELTPLSPSYSNVSEKPSNPVITISRSAVLPPCLFQSVGLTN